MPAARPKRPPAPSSAGVLAAQFVLGVWNWTAAWRCGVFNVGRAMSTWDRAHRDAFAAWAREGWLA